MAQIIELVHRSTTRQKACTGCVKAKRRCDLTIPSCSRCMARNRLCSYNDQLVAFAAGDAKISETPNHDPAAAELLTSPYDSFPFPELAVIEPHQIEYCVFELRRCVLSLAMESRAPFIHSDLYHDTMPDTYQDLLSICSLYNQKTETNSMIVFRMLFIKLKKLISSSRTFTQPEDWLLAVQTLIIYQIIRVFDGDKKQEELADQDFDLLENWSRKLQEVDVGRSTSHHQWLLMESIRRTLMVSVLFRCLYKILKDGMSDLVPVMAALPVSENTDDWDRVEGPRRIPSLVTYTSYVKDWNEGKVTTVDAYEMLLLKACRHAITI
ncbi:uncharacterized protein LY89DRAFT_618012 [Mollisia scopiformis]|uniref:Zn(2)-C6 fungal-type domain-containing protein n=1 Tax=Mollisia scopiformis TaxID=149040 RepID=A0A194X905_MOLSC|nr:uncharacterized protein LY89DRAFT_618012 [Mollisia scopiformis]KUJ16651.1 hypothetical protein LY89DRAFT_618012 [Mollisia scopiformis]